MGRHSLVDQPSPAPTRKVTAVGGTATAVALLVWVAHRGLGVDLDPELAALIVGALASVAGYLAKERRDQAPLTGQGQARHRYPPPPRRPPDDAGLTTVEILLLIIVVMLFVLVAVTTGVRIDV